jgi:hypothetical protein
MKGIIDQKILSSLKLIFKKQLTKFIWNSNQKKFIFEKIHERIILWEIIVLHINLIHI